AAPASVSFAELEQLVPAPLLERFDVLYVFAHRAREAKDDATRQRFVNRAAQLKPDDWRVLSLQAEILLEPIFAQEGLALTHAVPAALVGDLGSAIAMLQRAWDQLLTRGNARVGAFVAA